MVRRDMEVTEVDPVDRVSDTFLKRISSQKMTRT